MKRLFNFRIVPICFLGIILAICSVTFCSAALAMLFVAAAVAMIIASIFVERLKKAKGKLIAFSLVFLFATLITSMTYVQVENREIYAEECQIEGRVSILTDTDGNGEVVANTYGNVYVYLESVHVDGDKINGIAQAYFSNAEPVERLKVGDVIRFTGSISSKQLLVTDGYSVNDYKRGVYYYITPQPVELNESEQEPLIEYLGNEAKFSDKIKLKIKSTLYANVKTETAGFLYAMTLGDKSGLSGEIQSDFQRTGAAHIFAVSGLHVGIIAGAILLILKRLKVKNALIKFLTVAAVLIPFCILCDSPSTVRATVMTLIALGANVIMLRSDRLTNLSFAGCLILLINPVYLFDVGFLMSFFAIFGLLTLSDPISKFLGKIFELIFRKRRPEKLVSLLSATVSVNVSLLPIMVMYFGGQTLLSVIANIIVIPIACVFFPIYLAALIVACIIPFASVVLTVAGAPFTAMIWVVGKISAWETPVIYFQSGAIFLALTIFVATALSKYCFVNKKLKKVIAVALVLCICLTVACNITSWGNEDAMLYCFSDGSDAQYVILENVGGGRYFIVNGEMTGETLSSAREYMNKRGFVRIDGIVLVGDGFSADRVLYLAQNLGCGKVYTFSDSYESVGLTTESYAIEEGMTFALLTTGTLEILAGESVIRVLADGYSSLDDGFDILVTYDAAQTASGTQYVVSSAGYTNSLQNYLPTTFTFRLKNGKILFR